MVQINGRVVSSSNPNLSSAAAKRNEKPRRRLKPSEGQQGKLPKENHPQARLEVDSMVEEGDAGSVEALAT